jgi:hypothetical protein
VSVHDQRVGGVDKDCEQSDVKLLLKVCRWHSYEEMIGWLRRRRTEFITDPARLYHELKR